MIFLKKFVIATLAPSMRSPSSGITGWIARRIMQSANPQSTKHAIQNRLDLKSSDVFVELGAGEGAGLLAILQDGEKLRHEVPSQIHLVEISDAMRGQLERVVAREAVDETEVRVHGEDCLSMSYLRDDSVDVIFGMNVVYFLDPLPEYLREIRRVLKPKTGEIVWGCKFDKVPKDNEVFVNVDREKVVRMMEDAGFDAKEEAIDVVAGLQKDCPTEAVGENNSDKISTNDMRNYIEIRGRKV